MTKCDFCVNSKFVNGKTICSGASYTACTDAIRIFAEVLKEQARTTNTKNINKNYKYDK